MRKHSSKVCVAAAAMFVAGTVVTARAAITGNLSTTSIPYGAAITSQTVNTNYGDSQGVQNEGSYTDNVGGSELDAAYGNISGGNLNLLFTGVFESNGNHLNVFIDDGGAGGQSTLNVSNGWTGAAQNGAMFSPGFTANEFFDFNDYQGTVYTDEYDLNSGGSNNTYLGSVGLTNGVGSGSITNGLGVALTNTLVSGMGAANTPTNPAYVLGVTTGMEVSIPLSLLGNPSGPILVQADIAGSNDGGISNQFLPNVAPGLVEGYPGTFNFSGTPGNYFTVSVPEPTSIAVLGGAAMMLFARRRRA